MNEKRIEPRYLKAQEVADYLSIGRNTVDLLVKQGRLPEPISLTNKIKRWDRQQIDSLLSGGELDDFDEQVRRMIDESKTQGVQKYDKDAGRRE